MSDVWSAVQNNLDKLDPTNRAEAERLLAQLAHVYEVNPLERFIPNVPQAAFLSAGKVEVKMFAGGNGAGKTTVGVVDDLLQCVDRNVVPKHLQKFKLFEPPCFGRIVTPDFTSTMEGVVFEALRDWVPRNQLLGGAWDKAYEKQVRKLRFENGSWIDFLTYEQDVDKFQGATLHWVHFDEEPGGEKGRRIYNECRARLRAPQGGRISFTMTPFLGMSWTFDEVWERRNEDNVFAVGADTEANASNLPPNYIESLIRGMHPDEIKTRKEGKFVHFGGMVFDEFSEEQHIIAPPSREHILSQTIIIGIDPGIGFTGVSFNAFDNDNVMLTFDELILEGQTVPQVVEQIRIKLKQWSIPKPIFVIDPSARNRNAVNAEQVAGAFHREGIHTIPGQNAVEAGIFELKRRLIGDKWLISRDCPRTIWEIARYRIDSNHTSFAVIKENDHVLDSIRYSAMFRPWNVAHSKVAERRGRGWIPGFSMPEEVYVQPSPPMGSMS